MPRVSAPWKTWAVKVSRSYTSSQTWKLFATSRTHDVNAEDDKHSQTSSSPSAQAERPTIRTTRQRFTDEQKALLRRLRRSGTPMAQIHRESFPDFSLRMLYSHIEPTRFITPWTEAQDALLMRSRRKGMTTTEIIAESFPEHSVPALNYRMARLLARNHRDQNDLLLRRPCTPEKTEELKRLHAQGLQSREIAKVLGISYAVVRRRTREMKLDTPESVSSASAPIQKRIKWTQAEDALLQPYLATRFQARHFETLNKIPSWRRTFSSIETRLNYLRRTAGVTREWRRWSSEETRSLMRLRAEGLTPAKIAEKLDRKLTEVRSKLYALEVQPYVKAGRRPV